MRVRAALIVGMTLMLVGLVSTGAALWFGWIVPQIIGGALFLLGIFAVALWGLRCPRCGQRLGFKRVFFALPLLRRGNIQDVVHEGLF